MHLNIEIEREDDGRWISEIPQLPGVLVYGATPDEASARAEILARIGRAAGARRDVGWVER
jgi:predicted RNase H-like HicB family nuclease